ncbi:Vegetative incompatibility protein HET-E-1 [Colletotrichum sidae]|uniref:Vegetative incompatibility protein HET-E-1 n=1 Tax=Colletotrichum sidae TaxID=1347389 RepID=A0A4R8TDM3_9PEZI|nr:Vegetative incompatibility protein HET-E-1 [Colletotrichum sidae]
MRLINVNTGSLETFFANTPPYAILSHTWGSDEEELSYQDIQGGSTSKQGLGKLKFDGCCKRAKDDGYQYAWIDTCCIDQTNSVEVGEAINSMYRWYKQAAICYALLSDVSAGIETTFRKSRWFTRGWTLQELLAPVKLNFYDKDWQFLNSRTKLAGLVGEITGIPSRYLTGLATCHEASVAQRMSWAARRSTKRVEDIAYSLFGLFDVMIPMIYGEGNKAFTRLQKEIMTKTPDDSILARFCGKP